MYYERHYIIYHPLTENIPCVLRNRFGIKTAVINDIISNTPSMVVFDVAETHPQINEIEQFLSTISFEPKGSNIDGVEQISLQYHPVYSEEELNSAQWLVMRNTFNRVDPTDYREAFGSTCCLFRDDQNENLGRHCVQHNLIKIKNDIKWGKNHFASLLFDEYMIFCNAIAKNTLLSNGVKGISYLSVIKKSNAQAFDNVFQLAAENVIPSQCFIPLSNMNQRICTSCGMNMLQWQDGRGYFGVKAGAISQEYDFYDTLPMFFGPGEEPLYNAKKISIVSKKLYSIISRNNLGRNCTFTPLMLVE